MIHTRVSSILFIALSLFSSCKPKVSKDTINSYWTENTFFENGISNIEISKESEIKEMIDNYDDFILHIDSKRKQEFTNDTLLKRTLKDKQNHLIESLKKKEAIQDSLKKIVENNRLFIISLENNNISEEETNKKWATTRVDYNILISKSELISDEILEYKSQIFDIYKNALINYGVQTNTNKLKKGKK